MLYLIITPPQAQQEGLVIFWVNGGGFGTLELNRVNGQFSSVKGKFIRSFWSGLCQTFSSFSWQKTTRILSSKESMPLHSSTELYSYLQKFKVYTSGLTKYIPSLFYRLSWDDGLTLHRSRPSSLHSNHVQSEQRGTPREGGEQRIRPPKNTADAHQYFTLANWLEYKRRIYRGISIRLW